MSRLLFENSKVALGFAGVTIGAAALFAAFGGDSFGAAGQKDAPATTAVKTAAAKPAPTPTPTFEEEPEIDDFVADEELVDETEGFEPTPNEDGDIAELAEPGADDASDDDDAAASGPRSAPREASGRPSGSRQAAVTVSGNGAGGRSQQVEVGIAPGKGGNVTVSKDVKIKLQ